MNENEWNEIVLDKRLDRNGKFIGENSYDGATESNKRCVAE